MSSNKLEKLREIINTMISSDNYDYDELVRKSQELDELILKEIKKNFFVSNVLGKELLNEFDNITEKTKSFEEKYDSIRIVDPIKKEVLELKKDELCVKDAACYKFWEEKSFCEDCISMKAYTENDVKVKVKYYKNNIYVIVAIPILIKNKRLVLELLKNNYEYIK